MSSTRTAKDDSEYHQGRYASSPDFERGLIANLVAKRCALLDAPSDRELIWFVQHLSHQPGGLAAVATELLKKFSHRLGTPAMMAIGKTDGLCSADEVRRIRAELPKWSAAEFPLWGEIDPAVMRDALDIRRRADQARMFLDYSAEDATHEEIKTASQRIEEADAADAALAKASAAAQNLPATYPVKAFRDLCIAAATAGESDLSPLEKDLCDLCLKPSRDLSDAGPWYFADLVNVLREHHRQWVAEKSQVVVTTLGKKVCDALDYCAASHSLILLEGNARLGKSFSARAWCAQHPGKARFVEVPWGNDEKSFFHALARGLGLGSFLNYKVVEIRQRVESVLLAGDILLVMDEGQRLFPQRNFRCAFPGRVVWVMTMANAGVPICIISTPQFILSQKAMEKTGWNSAQLTGRIGHYEFLPTELTLADLMAVGRAVLPKASEEVLQVMASYARMSARYLAAVDCIATRAQFTAQRNGREQCTAADVRTAMQESVIPSDTMLVRTLEQARKNTGRGRAIAPMLPRQTEIEPPAVGRETRPAPAAPSAFHRRADAVELVES